MTKKELKRGLKFWLGPKILSWYLRLVGVTGSTIWLGQEHLDQLKDAGQSCIFCFWHRNATQATWALGYRGLAVLISASDDGELATRTVHKMGNHTVRGSSSKGGAWALLEMIRWLKTGKEAVITPDGPRGPVMKVQKGTITLASKSGVPLVPFHMESDKQWTLEKSWDTHRIPKLFAKKVICFGEPLLVPPKLNAEEAEFWREKVEQAMLANQTKTIQELEALG